MALISSLTSLTLDLPPSSISFVPGHPHLFVVGTYHLHRKEQGGDLPAGSNDHPDQVQSQSQASFLSPDPTLHVVASQQAESTGPHDDDTPAENKILQKRTGSLILYHLNDDNDSIIRLSTTPTDFAILDIQWSPHSEAVDLGKDNILAVAASTGIVAFYRLNSARDELVCISETQVADPSILVLSLAWQPQRPDVLGVTLSDGSVCLCENVLDAPSVSVSAVHAHTLEAWTLAFNTHNASQILSGGDDVVLQSSDPQWQDRRLHSAGVTAIHPLSESLIVTGSYDDHIRLLSCPPAGRRKCLAELNLGGGVWRLQRLDKHEEQSLSSSNQSRHFFLASCMHAGTRIVELVQDGNDDDNGVWHFAVLARFEEHKSMNYASAVVPTNHNASNKVRVVSTSFYDRLMCLWEWQIVV